MRSAALVLSVVAAYGLLRGFPEGWHGGLRSALAVVVLGLGVLTWRRRPERTDPVLASPTAIRLTSFLGLGVGVLALELMLWGVFGAMPTRLEAVAERFDAWLRPGGAARVEESEAGGGSARGGHWLINNTRMRPLPERTNLKPGNRPEVFVQPLERASDLIERQLYVHAFGLSEFRDGAWRIGSAESWEIPAGPDGWAEFGEDSQQEEIVCRMYHGYQENGENLVLGLQGLEAAKVDQVTEVDRGMHLLQGLEEGEDGYRYDSRSRPTLLDDLVGMEVSIPDEVPSRLMEMPDGALGFRLADLARVVQGEGSPVERLLRIRNHLRTTLDYSLVTENPNDRDPLENFLFYEQRGHCEFFATAGALLARAAGIPSRVCYGWTGGTYYETSGYFVFRTNEAHAWTEVLLEGWGWVVLDPTPADGLAAAVPRVADEDERPPGFDHVSDDGEETVDGLRIWAPLALLAIGLPLLCGLVLRSFRRQVRAGDQVRRRGSRSSGYVKAFLAACRGQGVATPRGATLRAIGDKLEEPPGFLDALLDYHYGTSYEGHERDRSVESSLEKQIRSWAAERR
ncbi:transglutaminase-like domain-containing protein [Haloferula rosea]|uniref:Transglutaminase domain-containing protein n=1 Tax=Haloferula rosea TaxID=490093 RepID=A0A934VEZ2_9BACT|nr:transglutaminase-like domain-containing protein [Haloferula rosea]MBK1826531.1 transglutaminase domain-containing protein [Haloferula rosea]